MSPVFVNSIHHLPKDSHFELSDVIVVNFEVVSLETDLGLPSFEDPLSHLSSPPLMSVFVEESPSLEDVDLIEP